MIFFVFSDIIRGDFWKVVLRRVRDLLFDFLLLLRICGPEMGD